MLGGAFRPLARPVTVQLLNAARRPAPLATPLRFSALRFLSTRYTSDHEWVTLGDDNIGTVGITDYAQKALGDVVFVELPTIESEIAQGDPIGAVESVKAASDIYAPVAGTVIEVNQQLDDQPGLLNKDPQGKGWLCKVRLSDPAEFEVLLNAESYKALCEGESGDDH